MYHYYQAITNTKGDSLVGYFARLIDPASGAVVALSADANGTPISTVSGVANMGKTDSAGNLSVYVAPGTYHMDIYGTDATTFSVRVSNVPMGGGTDSSSVSFVQAGTGATTRTLQDKGREIVSLFDYYQATDPDLYSAFGKSFTALATGGQLFMPYNGDLNIGSAQIASAGLVVPSGVEVCGLGPATRIVVTGGTQTNCVFNASNQSNVTFRNFSMLGNSMATNDNNGAAIEAYLTGSSNMANLRFENLGLSNFKAPAWIVVENQNAAKEIDGVFFDNIRGISATGNSIAPSDTSYLASVIVVNGSSGLIRMIRIDDLYAEATHIKSGAIIKGSFKDAQINGAHVLNAGLSGATDDGGAYGLAVYADPAATADQCIIRAPRIEAPRDCGIYVANCSNVTVADPNITGQTSTANTVIPKAAIAFNGTRHPRIEGAGRLSGNYIDVAIVPVNSGSTELAAEIDGLKTSGSTAYSIFCQMPSTGAASYDYIKVTNSEIASAGTAFALAQSASHHVGTLKLLNSTFTGAIRDIDLNQSAAAAIAIVDYTISGVTLNGTGTRGLDAQYLQGPLTISNSKLFGANGRIMLKANYWTQIHLRNLQFWNGGTGYALDTATASTITAASQDGLQFYSVTNINVASSLGAAIPTHTGSPGNIVQNLAPAAAGYEAWLNTSGTTWKGARVIQA